MKTYLSVSVLITFLLFSQNLLAQDVAKVAIRSSVVCEDCKQRVERDLTFEKGIKEVEVDLDNKIVLVTYHTGKTDIDKIRQRITKIGYTADLLPAEREGFDKLPACCKTEGACEEGFSEEKLTPHQHH